MNMNTFLAISKLPEAISVLKWSENSKYLMIK